MHWESDDGGSGSNYCETLEDATIVRDVLLGTPTQERSKSDKSDRPATPTVRKTRRRQGDCGLDRAVQTARLNQLLDDCSHAFIGSDQKMYLIVNGKTTPAPAGHYLLADGGCVTVGANAAVDPATLQHLTMPSRTQ